MTDNLIIAKRGNENIVILKSNKVSYEDFLQEVQDHKKNKEVLKND